MAGHEPVASKAFVGQPKVDVVRVVKRLLRQGDAFQMGGVFAEGFCVVGMGLHGMDLGFWKLAFEVERRESHIGPTVHNPTHI